MKDKNYNYLLFLIICIGALLRFYHMDVSLLYTDEINSITRSSRITFSNALEILSRPDVQEHPPLYYLLISVWLSLGKSEFVIRAFSALFGIMSVVLAYSLGKEMFNRQIGFITLLVVTFSPFHIYYSQYGKSYTMQTTFALWCLYCFTRIVFNKKEDIHLYIGYFLSIALGLWTFYFFIFLVVVQDLFLLLTFKNNKRYIKKLFVSQVSAFFVCFTWIFFSFYIYGNNLIKGTGQYDVPFTKLMNIPATYFAFIAGHLFSQSEGHFLLIAFVFIITTVIIISSLFYLKDDKEKLLFLLLCGTIPVISVYFFSFGTPLYNPRYTIIASLPIMILVAAGIYNSRSFMKKYSNFIVASFVFINSYSLYFYYYKTSTIPLRLKPDWGAVAKKIDNQIGKDEMVMFFKKPSDILLKMSKNITDYTVIEDFDDSLKVEKLLERINDYESLALFTWRMKVADKDEILLKFLEDKNYERYSEKTLYEKSMEAFELIVYKKKSI